MSYQDRLSKLENDIYERSGSMITLDQYKVYLPYTIIYAITFVLIYLIRPRWILTRVNRHHHKLSTVRFLIMWLLIGTALCVAYFKYGSIYFGEGWK